MPGAGGGEERLGGRGTGARRAVERAATAAPRLAAASAR